MVSKNYKKPYKIRYKKVSLWCQLNSNIKRLEKEGIYVELNRTATSRNYKAKFIDPLTLEE